LTPERVEDLTDPRVALYRGVRDPELLRDRGVFIAEGRLVVRRLLEHGTLRTRSVLVTPTGFESIRNVAAGAAAVYLVDQPVMEAITGFHIHRGCLALGERPAPVRVETILSFPGPLVIVERVGNPDNVGGIFRNAAALGAAGVLLSPGCGDPLYRKAIRTSMGATLSVPFAAVEPWPQALEEIARAGWTIVALTPDPAATPIAQAARALRRSRVTLLVGHEGAGLSPEALAAADVRASIPMARGADSLNVATATAIALHRLGDAGE
jgi:tRNA G18 (ribose-2'-O)-methylase SpoU